MNATPTATPWDALMRRPVVLRRQAAPTTAPDGKPLTKTAQLLAIIEQRRRVPTLALCAEVELGSRAVWGLLKTHKQAGQVRFDGTHWLMGDNYVPAKLQRAAQVLRQAGWTVVEPCGKGA